MGAGMAAMQRVRIIGHRGGKLVWPENGLTGFREVARLGVDGVEFDVHPSADGEIFVIHDPTLDRTTEASGEVHSMAAAELRHVRLRGGGGDRVPTLAEVLGVLGPAGIDLHVEIKLDARGDRYPGMEAAVMDALDRHGVRERSVVTSFSPDVLGELRRIAPRQRLLASVNARSAEALGGFDAALHRFRTLPVEYFAVEKSLLSETLSTCRAHFDAERVVGWVVNEPDEIAHWLRQDIGWIDTDRPDLAMRIAAGLGG